MSHINVFFPSLIVNQIKVIRMMIVYFTGSLIPLLYELLILITYIKSPYANILEQKAHLVHVDTCSSWLASDEFNESKLLPTWRLLRCRYINFFKNVSFLNTQSLDSYSKSTLQWPTTLLNQPFPLIFRRAVLNSCS